MKRYYIAYGSNLDIQQMRWRCPNARVIGISAIPDYELLYKGSKTGAYLTIEKKKGSVVPVAVWEVTETDEQSLDRYEGFPTFYYKKNMRLPVTLRNGKTKKLQTFVYIMHEERKLGIPSQACGSFHGRNKRMNTFKLQSSMTLTAMRLLALS